jgi:hypothetical protein
MLFADENEEHRGFRRSHTRAHPLALDQNISTPDRRSPAVDATGAGARPSKVRWRLHRGRTRRHSGRA